MTWKRTAGPSFWRALLYRLFSRVLLVVSEHSVVSYKITTHNPCCSFAFSTIGFVLRPSLLLRFTDNVLVGTAVAGSIALIWIYAFVTLLQKAGM